MFKSKTTFIVGAGASHEVGLPTGDTLKNKIADKLDISLDALGKYNGAGSRLIFCALEEMAKRSNDRARDIEYYLAVAQRISKAVRQWGSIDDYIYTQEDDELSKIAKFAIAEIILDEENTSLLQLEETRRKPDTIVFKSLEDTWYHAFFELLVEGVRKSCLDQLFVNINFISFNYDRTLEHYLFYALQNGYGVDADKAANVMKSLTILHPYGTVGKLEWQPNDNSPVKFGQNKYVQPAAENIQTFTEQMSDSAAVKETHDLISQTEQLCFLGFSFLDANMGLLNPAATLKAKRILATAHGISDSDCEVIKQTLGTLGRVSNNEQKNSDNNYGLRKLEVQNDLTCYKFFHKFSMSLRA